ncbi:MAG: PIG-L family deacetylase [Myxococcota bacterium]|nr:PIG-L family deacetylase [Myxococcota bacterium]
MLVPIPDLTRARRLLCVQPHYDDNDLAAGGTIATLAAAGAHVVYLTVADDLLGVLDPALSDDEARARIAEEQRVAGKEVGVAEQCRLELPDAGRWDVLALRDSIARELRRVNPDFLLTVDPWLADEAHRDHTRTGIAALEAALLFGLPRYRTTPEIDAGFAGSALRGVALYFTGRPNTWFDIGAGRDAKHRALDAYVSQLDPDTLRVIHAGLESKERRWGERAGCTFAEGLRVLHPAHLHCNPDAEEMV